MDNQQSYAPDTVQRLYELLDKKFGKEQGGRFNIFPAFPLTPPVADEMPCLIVDRMTDGAALGPTSTDESTEVIDVYTIMSLSDFVGTDNPRTDGKRQVEMFVQGQDPTTLDYQADTLYYQIRHYLSLLQSTGAIWLIDSTVQTSYENGKLADNITNAVFAVTRISTQKRVTVQNRQ